jgi:hypothetical protein
MRMTVSLPNTLLHATHHPPKQTRQEKARQKEERDAKEAKYKTALVDGREEQVTKGG